MINIYVSDNFNNSNNNFNKKNYKKIKESNFVLVGKIESNVERNNFTNK